MRGKIVYRACFFPILLMLLQMILISIQFLISYLQNDTHIIVWNSAAWGFTKCGKPSHLGGACDGIDIAQRLL
jgi:hypothetical protein